jgi:hypothetical protein
MVRLPSRKPNPFDSPAIYQIIAQGKIDPSWSDRLEGMTISQVTVDADPPLTTLEGELSDQAALAGVLNTLYELHLPLFSVKRLSVSLP